MAKNIQDQIGIDFEDCFRQKLSGHQDNQGRNNGLRQHHQEMIVNESRQQIVADNLCHQDTIDD